MQGTGNAEFEKAVLLFRAGNPAAAAQACMAILRRNRRDLDALYFLALMEMHQRRHADAERSFAKAIALAPGAAEIWANRGNNLIALERPDGALDAFDHALALQPNFPEVLYNKAKLLEGASRLEEALASYDACAALVPQSVDVLNNRGVLLARLRRYQEALASYDNCLAITPNAPDTLSNRGNLLATLQRYGEALASYDQSLAISPNAPNVLVNRGNLLATLQRYDEALASYDKSLAIAPNTAETLYLRGNVLVKLDRSEEAVASYDRCLTLAPTHAGAWSMVARLLMISNRYEEAERVLQKLVAIDRCADYALSDLVYAKLNLCNWNGLSDLIAELRDRVRKNEVVTVPFNMLSVMTGAEDQLLCARRFQTQEFPAASAALWRGVRKPHDRIRLAYLSADFREHPVGYLLAGLIEQHDKARFETTAISLSPASSGEMQRRFRGAFERFVDARDLNDREVAEFIHCHEIDILVDLMGYTTGARPGILAMRPTPVQVNYFGYGGTMGADYVDYIIADRHLIPENHQVHYSEKVVYLPDTYQPNDSTRRVPETAPSRAEAGLPDRGFVFCSFNNNSKIMPDIFEVWMRLLRQVEDSVLWILTTNPAAERNIREAAERHGVAAARLVFAPKTPYDDHLARHRLADLFLDTLPFNAHVTASDALWTGLPLITCLGSTFAARVAGSLLYAVGLPELVTTSLADYEALAIRLARDPALLGAVKTKLAAQRHNHALFDTGRYRRHIEAAYAAMYDRHLRGEPPASFAVAPIAPA
jgi:protein O-GlcNAc transferase